MSDSESPRCSKCGYELTGLGWAGRCPECGQPFNRKTFKGIRGAGEEMSHILRRVRTLCFGAAACVIFLASGAVEIFASGSRWPPILLLLAVLVTLMTLTSYLYEKNDGPP